MENNCCLEDVLKVIDVLQKNADCDDVDASCKRPFLGTLPNAVYFNTRPITLYTPNATLIETDYEVVIDGITTTGTSSIYRVEDVKDCCVTCNVLAPNPDTTNELIPYIRTNTYITFNLNCIGAVRCLQDVIVNN